MSDFRNEVANYISETFSLEDKLLQDVIQQQQDAGGPMMNIGPDQGKFLDLLIKIHKPRKVLEIGSYYGYSAIWIARALKSNLDRENNENAEIGVPQQSQNLPLLSCVEKSSKQIEIIQTNLKNAGLDQISEVLEGSALDFMQKQPLRSFDLIFIDADKANYPQYFMLAEKILKPGGLLLVDNVLGLYDYEVIHPSNEDPRIQAIRKFNKMLASSESFDGTILTIQSGLAMAIKK